MIIKLASILEAVKAGSTKALNPQVLATAKGAYKASFGKKLNDLAVGKVNIAKASKGIL